MRKTLLVLFALAAICAAGQTAGPDSTKVRELKEVVIEGENQQTSATKTTYIPTSGQKEMAEDATSLLSRMAIPQLDVNPITNAVKTLSGKSVAIYINHVPATEQDLTGMRPTDVRRVEYMLFPKDPRFKGAPYVINFVMVSYEWGGYTKLNARQSFGVKKTRASVFSKFAYKSMIYDIYVGENYSTDRNKGAEAEETFRFTNLNDKGAATVTRYSTPLRSRYRNNANDVTFRAVYASKQTQIYNILSFTNTSVPRNDLTSRLEYKNNFLPQTTSSNVASSHGMGLRYALSLYSALSEKLVLSAEGYYQYNRNKPDSRYEAGDVVIVNNARENLHEGNFFGNLLWNLDKHNSITATVAGSLYNTSVDYLGTSASRQKYDIYGLGPDILYKYNASDFNAGASVGWVYAHTEISGTKIIDKYPQFRLFTTYSPNRKNQFSFTWYSHKDVPEIYQKSPTMLRQDELMWYAGNVNLKNVWVHDGNISYTWLPDNKWQMAGSLNYTAKPNRVQPVYRPDGPDGTMLRRYMNDGDYSTLALSLNATAKFLDGTLVARLNPTYTHTHVTGEYAMTLDRVDCTAQLSWYVGRCSLSGYYMTPIRYGASDFGYCTRYPSTYQIQLSWRRKQWSVNAYAVNFARSSLRTMRQTLTGAYYTYDRNDVYEGGRRQFRLSVTYTIGYGRKKVSRRDETDGGVETKSSILR